MRQVIIENHKSNDAGDPTGGTTSGVGFAIAWQDGPLDRGGNRKEPNGAFVEGIIRAAIGRLDHYQASRFNCDTNRRALEALHTALAALDERTADREARGVEGLHEK